jgi:malate dehydrogenase (oxaloacetate-decarboxylating)(NADP+)
MTNALEIQGKTLAAAKIVCLGAGAAATACCNLMIAAGVQRENILMVDSKGVIYKGRDNLNEYKELFAHDTTARTLDDAIEGADAFLGLSGPNLLSVEQLLKMAANPVVFACSNPDPEINPAAARAARSDLIMATGRSDYPNQVNNVLCFPFLFRGTLDVRARMINEQMKLAAVEAIKELAKQPVPDEVRAGYDGIELSFGAEYILPKPTDPRLLGAVAAAVAKAAVDSGVARLPYPSHYPLTCTADVRW